MNDTNHVALVGRLTRDVELKYTQGGMAIAELSIANNQSKKVGESWEDVAHFFDASIIGKRAEALSQYLTKGTQVVITGKLQQQRWETKDGDKRSKVSILVDNVQLVGGKGGQSQTTQSVDTDYEIPF